MRGARRSPRRRRGLGERTRLVAGTSRLEGRPHAHHRRRLELRPRGAPAVARRFRRHPRGHSEARGHDARGGGPLPRRVRRHSQRPPPAVRALRPVGRDAHQLPAQPPGGHRDGGAAGRGDGREGEARDRQPPHAARVGPLLLLAARHAPGDAPRRLLVGRAHARHAPPARREAGAVLARPLRHRREQGARLPQDAAADRDLRAARRRQLPRPRDRRGAGPGDALLPRRRREREGRRQRELRPRGDGAVHDGRGQLLRDGRARGGAGVHRLELREPGLRGAPGAARRGREDVPGPHGELRRRGGARHHPGAGGDGGVHRGEALPLLRARGPVGGAGVGAGLDIPRTTATSCGRC